MHTTRTLETLAFALIAIAACGDDSAKDADATTADAIVGDTTTDATADDTTTDATVGDATTTADADTTATGVPLVEFCQRAAVARQALYAKCFGVDEYPPDAPHVASDGVECARVQTAIDGGRLRYDADAAATCLAYAESRECIGGFEAFFDPSCRAVFTGQVAAGGDCYPYLLTVVASNECARGVCYDDEGLCPAKCHDYPAHDGACGDRGTFYIGCDPASDFCNADGHCQALPQIGDACPDFNCAPGAVCESSDDTSKCVASAQGDEVCSENVKCTPPAFQCLAGQCRFNVAAGEPCLFDLNCPDGTRCATADGADATPENPKLCRPPVAAGEACARPVDCVAGCWCNTREGTPGECQNQLAEHADCGDSQECQEGLWCQYVAPGATCVKTGGDGGDCSWGGVPTGDQRACGEGLICMGDALCHPPGAAGEPCSIITNGSCQAGLWCDPHESICKTPAAAEGACSPFDRSSCGEGLSCHCTSADDRCGGDQISAEWHCAAPTPIGEACWDHNDCGGVAFCNRCQGDECTGFEQPGVCAEDAPVCKEDAPAGE